MDRIKHLLGKNRKTYNGLLLVIFTAILFFITFHKFETDKLELEVGKDLQFIRVNGTLVGGLVGLIIYVCTLIFL